MQTGIAFSFGDFICRGSGGGRQGEALQVFAVVIAIVMLVKVKSSLLMDR